MVKLDQLDIKILEILQNNNRLKLNELAKMVNMSIPPCQKRLSKLKDAGIIQKNCAIIDWAKITSYTIVFTRLKLTSHTPSLLEALIEELNKIDNIIDIFSVSGEYDLMLKMQINNISDYGDIVYRLTEKFSEITILNTEFAIKNYKENIQVPVSIIQS